jgi:MoxR-like ATPase
MDFPFYQKILPESLPSKPVDLPPLRPLAEPMPESYVPDDDLVEAVNVALLLGQPLLLTGEPGTGKTHLAYHVAKQFGLSVLKFETKSNSKAQDLFYTYDAMKHFHAIQIKQSNVNAIDYLEYTALGEAIIRANQPEKVQDFLPSDFIHIEPRRSVVLIDEVDKAPRDFPNDILNEIENMDFSVPELGTQKKIRVEDAHMKPILILTSNSEKHLPDAFLRRCIYYNIPFPTKDRLRDEIIKKRLGQFDQENHKVPLSEVLNLFFKLREVRLQKKPATAELLNWLMALHQMFHVKSTSTYPDDLPNTLSILVKNTDDQELAKSIFQDWLTTVKA